ncbi:aldo-keto reductase IolS-like [Oscarella lobularis]|uniref:aldo-keto reductase IolS-like n=1 Tax=Oscarella lobularis TaxID=121494 RepID=UPI0033132A10
MERRCLGGDSELSVSPICLGTWQFGGTADNEDNTWGYQEEETSKQIVNKALELGINFFDTAEAYGRDRRAERMLARCLEGRHRADVVIASKFGRFEDGKPKAFDGVDIEKSLDETLEALKTTYVDIYQIHWAVNIKDPVETVTTLERLKAKGKLRHYGLSNFGRGNMREFKESGGKPVTNQLPYNLLWRAVEYDITAECKANNIGILAYSPLAQGLLSGRFTKPEDVPEGRRRTRHFSKSSTSLSRHGQEGAEKETFEAIEAIRGVCRSADISMPSASLAWLLAQPNVASCIVGARTAEQVEANARLVQLSEETIKKLSAASETLKEKLGSNPDMWASESRYL